MPTFKLTVAYDGTDFAGWQSQSGQRTVQATLEESLARITGQTLRVAASGRTDAGVHALGQVVSLELETRLTALELLRALNSELPADVAVLASEQVAAGFHAIRDAVRKQYRYQIHDGYIPDVFRRRHAWHVRARLDHAAMQRSALSLVGRHDFRSFESRGSPRTTSVRTVSRLTVTRGDEEAPHLVMVEIEADGFLYNMARAIVGTLVDVGRGARPESWPGEVLQAADRGAAGMTAPAHGLFLVRVDYPACVSPTSSHD